MKGISMFYDIIKEYDNKLRKKIITGYKKVIEDTGLDEENKHNFILFLRGFAWGLNYGQQKYNEICNKFTNP